MGYSFPGQSSGECKAICCLGVICLKESLAGTSFCKEILRWGGKADSSYWGVERRTYTDVLSWLKVLCTSVSPKLLHLLVPKILSATNWLYIVLWEREFMPTLNTHCTTHFTYILYKLSHFIFTGLPQQWLCIFYSRWHSYSCLKCTHYCSYWTGKLRSRELKYQKRL